MTDLNALLERVHAATGPSTVLDAEIYATIDGAPHTTTAGARIVPLVMKGDPTDWPAYTAYIDAAMAFTERVLPGWGVDLQRLPEWARMGLPGPLWSAFVCPDDIEQRTMVEQLSNGGLEICATAPLAIVAATLAALIAGEAK